jgi:hypothetical protein
VPGPASVSNWSLLSDAEALSIYPAFEATGASRILPADSECTECRYSRMSL